MKRFATILLLGLMLTTAFSKVFIVLDYEANKDFITKFLCINREKPKMHCNGKCYLAKKLKKAEQEGSSSAKDQKQKQVINLFYQPMASSSVVTFTKRTISYAVPPEDRPVSMPLSFFHPPKPTV